jgi:hypothetical protein
VRLAIGAVLFAGMLATSEAQAASCRNYGQEIQAAIKGHVVALRKIEHETADRITGLDTRPFDYLLTQARTAADAIGDKFGLDEEAALSRCRNYIAPVRHTCAAAATALVAMVEALASGSPDMSSKPNYIEAMPKCERWMGLTPLRTTLRATG